MKTNRRILVRIIGTEDAGPGVSTTLPLSSCSGSGSGETPDNLIAGTVIDKRHGHRW